MTNGPIFHANPIYSRATRHFILMLEPLNISPLTDAQTRFRRDFNEFARQWQETKEVWKDERARRFEQEELAPLGPSLSRFTATLAEFTETLRKAQKAIDDSDAGYGEVY